MHQGHRMTRGTPLTPNARPHAPAAAEPWEQHLNSTNVAVIPAPVGTHLQQRPFHRPGACRNCRYSNTRAALRCAALGCMGPRANVRCSIAPTREPSGEICRVHQLPACACRRAERAMARPRSPGGLVVPVEPDRPDRDGQTETARPRRPGLRPGGTQAGRTPCHTVKASPSAARPPPDARCTMKPCTATPASQTRSTACGARSTACMRSTACVRSGVVHSGWYRCRPVATMLRGAWPRRHLLDAECRLLQSPAAVRRS